MSRYRALTAQERLRIFIEVDVQTGCWLWTGPVGGSGYGRINGPVKLAAHRVAYEMAVGPIPDGKFVCHRCDVKLCVNPAHLSVGTARENSADMVAKGRSPRRPGAENGNARLSEFDVLAIRLDDRPHRVIGAAFGVSHRQIGRIKRREKWKHIM